MLLAPFTISTLTTCSFEFLVPHSFFVFFCAPFSFFCAPCSFLILPHPSGLFYCSMLLFRILLCSMLLFIIASGLSFVCSLLLFLFYSLLLAPLYQIGHAPCSGITPHRGSIPWILRNSGAWSMAYSTQEQGASRKIGTCATSWDITI